MKTTQLEVKENIDGMSAEDAREHFSYNTLGTFDSMDNPNKPIFMYEE